MNSVSHDSQSLDNLIAMANLGRAFSAISVFEDSVATTISISKTEIAMKLDLDEADAVELFASRNGSIRRAPLGILMKAIRKSGIEGRDITYLNAIVDLRNDFIHRLMEQVLLPGDWERFGYSLEQFSAYTSYVSRHIGFATYSFSRIMLKHGLVRGSTGSFGALLYHPDFPFEDGYEEY
ncbi:hypothetical protein MHM88_15440 [Epibacterium sp. MM17-32]|uniref:hypothetical protein n=1 Tax=Epibacterium sp. MM17-32 TaxID=2917734 RepID=UPI001EF5AB63|nr:hypothetical protein [Epibacterium sp. MM17-32]MCG7629203.1 hypothetical protein [Epibacterium sp. MM17-32]